MQKVECLLWNNIVTWNMMPGLMCVVRLGLNDTNAVFVPIFFIGSTRHLLKLKIDGKT